MCRPDHSQDRDVNDISRFLADYFRYSCTARNREILPWFKSPLALHILREFKDSKKFHSFKHAPSPFAGVDPHQQRWHGYGNEVLEHSGQSNHTNDGC
jgi:hypothetical protein